MVEWHKIPEGEAPLDPLTSLAGLTVAGEDLRATLEEVATATTLTENHFLVLVNGNITITLPKAVNHKERIYTIKNIGQGQVTIDAYSNEEIDGEVELTLSHQYSYVTIVSDGDEWFIIGGRNMKSEQYLEEIRDSLSSPLDKLLYIMARMERMLDDSTDTEVEKQEIENEIKELEVSVRE